MPAGFDRATISQVLAANDIIDVVGEHLSLTKKGREMVGLCPFHDDHKPSLYVNPEKQIFKCFACSAGGSVFTFVQMRENLNFPQAVERLANRAGIKLTYAETRERASETPPDVDPNALARVNAWAAKYFHKNLLNADQGKAVRDYLAKRKITPESTEKFQLGLALNARDHLIRAAANAKIPPNLLAQAGLAVGQRDMSNFADKFVNRLIFPITDVTGRTIAFGGRILDGQGAKYINSPTTALFDKSNSLYGLGHARHAIVASGTAVLVEGYTDCIMAHQCGCANVVATLGTSLTEGHARILRRYAKQIVLVFDSDAAGAAAANRALDVCLAQRADIKLASLPGEKDPCDFLITEGMERFQQQIQDAVDVLEFKWSRLQQTFRPDATFVDNKTAVEEFLNTVATSLAAERLAPIEKGLLVNRLSNIIGLEAKQVNRELSRRVARAAKTAAYNVENQKVTRLDLGHGLGAAAQRELLEVLLNQPKLYTRAKNKVSPELFDVLLLRQVADTLFNTLDLEPTAVLSDVLAAAESVEASRLIVELAQTGEQKANYEARLDDALDAIDRCHSRQRKPELKAAEDQKRFLQNLSENTRKVDPHNVGMV
ncbi:MAG: DNA primase [Planctomycetota bacterium]|jgi:DNA primase